MQDRNIIFVTTQKNGTYEVHNLKYPNIVIFKGDKETAMQVCRDYNKHILQFCG